MTSMPVVDYPHLETPVRALWDFPHPDLLAEHITVDVVVRRWASEPEPFIYVEKRGEMPMLRLREQDAERLVDALTKAILAARVQASVDLPAEPTPGGAR